jgi:hypothetical protein
MRASLKPSILDQIADRATQLFLANDIIKPHVAAFVRASIRSDVLVVHVEILPLRLHDLYAADDADFTHDICGIGHHLDLHGPRLTDCFVPRFAA